MAATAVCCNIVRVPDAGRVDENKLFSNISASSLFKHGPRVPARFGGTQPGRAKNARFEWSCADEP